MSMSPRSANVGSASTRSTPPRATTRADWMPPSSSTVPTKQTSFPRASRIAARIASAAAGARRVVEAVGTAGMVEYTEELPKSLPFDGAWRLNPLRLQRLLLRCRKQHVVQDQPVPGRVRVQRQIGGRATDGVLRILRVVAAVVRPRPLSVVAVNVFDPRRALLDREDRHARLQRRLGEARRHTVEIVDDGAVALHEHRRDRIELR